MAFDNLRIIRLQADNVKRLVAVDIKPNGDIVTIAGENGQGKTSVLDSILWAMAGGRTIQWKPIREGEEKATIRLELGNAAGLQLVVTRTFSAKDDGKFTTNLTVRTADGMKPQGEQGFLDAMVGALSFDPAAFTRKDAKGQIEILKSLIAASNPNADFDAIDARRKKAFEERTEARREASRLRASSGEVDGDAEDLEDTSALLSKMAEAGNAARERAAEESRRERMVERRDYLAALVTKTERDIIALQVLLENHRRDADAIEAEVVALEDLPALESLEEVRDQLLEVEERNNEVKHRNGLRLNRDLAARQDEVVVELGKAIDACDAEVRDLIERAHLPVSGLALSPDSVMLRGVPFDQASDAEQLRASMALGMAANPRLRVLRIRDGSLLDRKALSVIQEVAGDMDFQIWIERVGEGDSEAFVLENGMLRS